MGVRLTFRPEHLSPSFSTINKFILVTCEYSSYLSSLLVLTRSIQTFPTFTVAARVICSQSNSLCPRLSTDEKFTKFANFYFVITNKMIRILWTRVTWIHNSSLNIFFTRLSKIAKLKFTIFCNNHLLIRIKMSKYKEWYDMSDWTRNIESKLIMVIFAQLIQRYLVCVRESIILQFFFFLFLIFLSSQNFNDGMLHDCKDCYLFANTCDFTW